MKKISNFMIFSMFLTVVGAPAMSMTSHTIKADDAQKKKRRKIIGGVVGAAAAVAAGAAAYKYRANIGNTFNQVRGKPTKDTATATAAAAAKPAQTQNTQSKTTSSESRDTIKQVKADNTGQPAPAPAPAKTDTPQAPQTSAPQSEAPKTSYKSFAEIERDGYKNAPPAPKFDQKAMLRISGKDKAQAKTDAPAPTQTDTPQAPAPTQTKTLAEQLQEQQAKLKPVSKEEIEDRKKRTAIPAGANQEQAPKDKEEPFKVRNFDVMRSQIDLRNKAMNASRKKPIVVKNHQDDSDSEDDDDDFV